MKILCTMPGKFGDIFWSLATVRAISETFGQPVDFVLSKETPSLLPLLNRQPYIRDAFMWEPWIDVDTLLGKQIQPSLMTKGFYDRVFHLSYRGWPQTPLPFEIHLNARAQYETDIDPIDLDRPWITVPPLPAAAYPTAPLVIGFSDEWFELKYGLTELLHHARPTLPYALTLIAPHSRWALEGRETPDPDPDSWERAASIISGTKVCLACNSAYHVLAIALGKQVVMMEPNVQRHNPIFFPLGTEGRVKLVKGHDGQPTWDARHVYAEVQKFL